MKRLIYHNSDKGVKTAWSFIAVVFIIIIAAILVKFITLFANSSFDARHRFTILLDTKPTKIISVSPADETISVLTVKSSDLSLEETLGIFVDASVKNKQHTQELQNITRYDNPDAIMRSLLSNYTKVSTELTIIDVFRLLWFANSVKPQSVFVKNITVPEKLSHTALPLLDKQVQELFIDPTIISENISISVVNGSTKSGLGNTYARVLTNMGVDVVSIESADKPIAKSKVMYFGELSYTAKRLSKIFGYPLTSIQKRGISDIIIHIGRDYGNYHSY